MTRSVASLLLFALLLIPGALTAQTFETGMWGGISSYNGDLNRDMLYKDVYPAAGLLFRYNFNQRLSARMTGSFSLLTGDDLDVDPAYHVIDRNPDPDIDEPWYEFETDIHEFSLQLEFNILPFEQGNMSTRIAPYVFAGGGAVYFYPTPWEVSDEGNVRQATEGEHWHDDDDEEYTNRALLGLGGIGVRMNLTSSLSMGLEMGLRITNTDYIDEVHQKSQYTDENDWYTFTGITLTYGFERSSRRRGNAVCPY